MITGMLAYNTEKLWVIFHVGELNYPGGDLISLSCKKNKSRENQAYHLSNKSLKSIWLRTLKTSRVVPY